MKKLICILCALLLISALSGYAGAEGLFDLLDKSDICVEADLEKYYLDEMVTAAKKGEVKAGQTAEANRNTIIEQNGSESEAISFDELYLLARLISSEAGSDWLTDEFRMCFGEVVMNRVASPEFPDTLSGVIYQKGQYSAVTRASFDSLVPMENCVDISLRLLQGERLMAGSVVYCSGNIQGDVFSVYEDWRLGVTYFCVSKNIDLYPID